MFCRRFGQLVWLVALAGCVLSPAVAAAVQSGDRLLPKSTRAFISIPRQDDFDARWDRTDLGMLLDDESMQPFIKDMRNQVAGKLTVLEDKLGITIGELRGTSSGELCVGLIELSGREAAVALTIDITGREREANELVARAEARLKERGARKQEEQAAGTRIIRYQVPKAAGEAVYFFRDNMLCAVDDTREAQAMLRRFSQEAGDSLRNLPAYEKTRARCEREADQTPADIRWFVDPWGFVRAWRSFSDSERLFRDKDIIQILSDVGFDAIQGAGGFVHMMVAPNLDFVHRTAIYAPPVASNATGPDRWRQAMRMLQMPNASQLQPQQWAPQNCASYTTLNLDIQTAFDNVHPLFDALAGYEDAFKTTMEGFQKDPYGPQVDMRKDFVAHLGNRVTVITRYAQPITPDSERFLYAVDTNDQQALAATLDKIMKNDPDAVLHTINNISVWEVVEPQFDPDEVALDTPALNPLFEDEFGDEFEEEERVLPNSAVCVARGHLIIASGVDYLREVLDGNDILLESEDYQLAHRAAEQLAPGPRSGWMFTRSDQAVQPNFELIKQGKMPEAKTTLGRILNELLTTEVEEEEGVLRRQRIEGSKLPPFESVRKYLGPAGNLLRSEQDGWFAVGALLRSEGI